ncbi:MAG: putative phospholipase D family protein, partial [uncultured Chloroflexia bacterium]
MQQPQSIWDGVPSDTLPRDPGIQRALQRISNAELRTGNSLALLQDGPATFDDWLGAIGRARRWVHLENYIFKPNDQIGKQFTDALIERARAGVAVRVLYDWFGSWDVPTSYWERMRKEGVDVRAVNSLVVGAPFAAINRDHRKLVAVDGTYASIGGVCIADPWLQRSPITNLPYRDTAVRVHGPAVADLERAFARIWDRTGAPLPTEEQPRISAIATAGDVAVRVIVEEPGRMRMLGVMQLALASARSRLWIADAYFLAVPQLRETLIVAASAGVDVRILLPATNDLPIVGAFSRAGYRPFLEAGVRIWEYSGLMMHAKTSVGDGCWARVGSTNLNVTGLLTNWEMDILAEDPRFGAQMEVMYLEDLSHAREIRLRPTHGPGLVRLGEQPKPDRVQTIQERRAQRDRGLQAPASATVA